ncbi:MAG: YdcF family protein [Edaphobacter sp.]
MIAPTSNLRRRGTARGTFLRSLLGVILLVLVAWCVWVYQQIAAVASHDEAQPADAIAVFGAAEYLGHPSPVLHARLDHAVELYRKQIAPLIITLGGGSDKDSGNTEGGVGRDYLLANGIPFGSIIAETHSIDTEQQVHRLAAIAHENNLHHIVVVSDATHLFRIRELCKEAGLDVYTSPRPPLGHISNYDLAMRYFHEILSYTAMRLNINI